MAGPRVYRVSFLMKITLVVGDFHPYHGYYERESTAAVEVKAAASVHPGDVRHVHTFLDEYSDLAQCGIVLYDGEETFWLTERVLAAPWWRII